DGVARTDVAFTDDAQIRTHATLGLKPLRKTWVPHADAELEAGKARLRDFQQRRPDLPALADQRVDEIDAFDRQVLAEQSGRGVHRVSIAPPVVVLARVGVHRLVRPTVHLAIGLIVPVEIDAADCYTSL